MQPSIETLQPKSLVGMRQKMSLAANTTAELWRRFMPRRREVQSRVTNEYISMQVYSGPGDDEFNPETEFEKWAAVEVANHDSMPDGMESYALTRGQYAVFVHEGPASAAPETMRHIFAVWLPNSGYELDAREHFEVLPESYDPRDPQAREEVWIPIRQVLPHDACRSQLPVGDAGP